MRIAKYLGAYSKSLQQSSAVLVASVIGKACVRAGGIQTTANNRQAVSRSRVQGQKPSWWLTVKRSANLHLANPKRIDYT